MHLLSSRVEGVRGWLLRMIGLGKQEPATLDFTYVTDHGRHLLHYVASGISDDHPQLSQLYFNVDVTCQSRHAAQRAALLSFLFESSFLNGDVDLNITDAGGKSLVFWAVVSHSVEVLDVLCAHAQTHGIALNVAQPDHTGTAPLDIAVASQQWAAVKTLVSHGALRDSVRLKTAMESLPSVGSEVSSRAVSAWASLLGGFFGWSWPGKAACSMTKSTSLASLGPSEDGEGDSSLAVHSAAPLVFSGIQEVEEFWNQQALHVSSLCSVSIPVARQLLKEHNHDLDAAIQGYLMQKGKGNSFTGSSSADRSMQTCCICFQRFCVDDRNVVLPCGHVSTCSICWGKYVVAQLEEGQAAHLQCTEPSCTCPVPLEESKKVISAQKYAQLERQVLNSYVDSNPSMKWCPRPGCGCSISLAQQVQNDVMLVKAIKGDLPLTVHCKCGHAFCWHCGEPAHEPALCNQVKDWKKLLTEEHKQQDHESEVWVSAHTQPCPNCSAKVQRSGGCNHMICTVCGQHFCYVCGRDWSLHGPQSGGFYACTLALPPPPMTSLGHLSLNIGGALKSVWKTICSRQAAHMRRYFAQSDDNREFAHLVHRISHILKSTMPDRACATATCAHLSAFAQGAAFVPVLEASATSTGHEVLGHSNSPAAGVTVAADGEHANGKVQRATSGCTPQEGCEASCQVGTQATAEAIDRGTLGAEGMKEISGERQQHALSCESDPHACSSSKPRVTCQGEGPPSSSTNASSVSCAMAEGGPGLHQSKQLGQRLSADSPMDNILAEWEQAMAKGRTVLRNTCIATFYMQRSAERQYLESLQCRLEVQLGQLTDMLQAMPHRRTVLEGHSGEECHALAAQDAISAIFSHIVAIMRDIVRGILSLGNALLSSQGSALHEISVQGQQIRDQFYYAVALNQQRTRIVRLLQRVNHTCHAIVRTGQVRH
jgi:hypothetical protein